MPENHQTEYDIYIQGMSEDNTQHKLRKSKVLLKYSVSLLEQAYNELQFGVGRTRPSNDEAK